jgi:quinol-cytochrome oxidoreductase complex cytochrome b subunit
VARSSQHGVLQAVWSVLRSPVPPEFLIDLAFGWLILTLFLVQVVTGIMLSLYYQPSPPLVAESVQFIMRDVDWGWLIRGVHHWASHAMILLCALQIVRSFALGRYRGAGSPNWYVGLLVLALIVASTYSGELLTWDQVSYWRLSHALDRIGSLGSIGATFASIVRGGNEVTATTLSRTYSAHGLFLPWLAWMLLIANLWFLARRMKAPRESFA